MMSVTELDIGWSWFITFYIFNVVSSTFVAAVSMVLFENSRGIYLWTFWILSFLSITVFSMFLSSFSSKSNRAILIGLLTFFLGIFLTFAVNLETGNPAAIAIICLHPVGAYTFGLQEIGRLEDTGVGLQSDNVQSTDSPSNFTFNDSLQFMIIDSVLWGICTWYFNRVLKPDFGQALPPFFPFTRTYWFPGKSLPQIVDDEFLEEDYYSSIPFECAGRRNGCRGNDIVIRHLRKKFGKITALDGLSLNMYESQVTALLGHNGAGKSTTINLLSKSALGGIILAHFFVSKSLCLLPNSQLER